MDPFNNPFVQDQPSEMSIDKFAQQMMQTIKKLKQNKEKINVNQKIEMQDEQMGEEPIHIQNASQNEGTFEACKRQNLVKIMTVPKKRIKTNSQYQSNNNQDSQYIDSVSNRRITDYYGDNKVSTFQHKKSDLIKNISSNQEEQESQVNMNPIIKSLRQKIGKKKKAIQQLQAQFCKIKEKNQKNEQEIKLKKENQKIIMTQYISQKYAQKIYNQGLKQIRKSEQSNSLLKRLLAENSQKTKNLKNQKTNRKYSKNKNSIVNEQSNFFNFLQIYGQQRQAYLTAWKKKLQNQKSNLDKQLSKNPFWQSIQIVQEKYHPLPEIFLDQKQNRLIFQKIYLPLYCRFQQQAFYQIRVLNLQKLWHENLSVVFYPKIMKKEKRMEMKLHIKSIFEKSIQLNDDYSNSIFTNNTLFTQIQTSSQEMIVIGRSVQQEDLPKITFKNIIQRYEFVTENIAKYTIKIILRAHERIRKQLNHQAIILPQNIIFNERNDIKVDNWVQNQIYRFIQFSDLLNKEDRYLYFPPQYKLSIYNEDHISGGTGIWGVGVMLYEMLLGRKPYVYSNQMIDHEQFYVMNDLQFPSKPQLSENSKQILKLCLCKPQHRITFQKILKHPFFDIKK